MTVTKLTKTDYIERQPEIEDLATRLRKAAGPRLAVRITRKYWWSVEYLWWDTDTERWYGCVQNYDHEEGWETTDVGEYEDNFWGALCDGVDPEHENSLQIVPFEETPAVRGESA